MKAYLFCSPEFSFDTLKGVASLLNNVPGEIKFEVKKSLSPGFYKKLNAEFAFVDDNSELSFDELFHVTGLYRSLQEINPDDFVIFITSIRNDKQWFSAFDQRDIFIHGAEWDLNLNIVSKFELAYQCVENIFQSLINLEKDEYHDPSIGCINDLCAHKPDILLKLQTGNICKVCIQKAKEKGIENSIMKQILTIITNIRNEFVISTNYFNNPQPDPVIVDENGKIRIGDKEIKLEFLPRVMYITFLKYPEGFLSSEKCKKFGLFLDVATWLKPIKNEFAIKARELSIKKMCCRGNEFEIRPFEGLSTFETYRSKIKAALKKAIGENDSNLYCISLVESDDRPATFQINLSEDFIRFL
jgi:hypothetical protein